jgi:hypothetical protein
VPDGPPRRLILPAEVPETAARILALAGWETVRVPAGADDAVAVWRRAPGGPGEIGLEPLHLGDPGRIAGLRLHPGDDRLGRPLSRLLDEEPLDDTALLDRARDAMERMRYWGLATAPIAPAAPAPPPDPGYVLVLDEPPGAAPRADLLETLFVAQEDLPRHRLLVLTPPGGGQIRDTDLARGAARVNDARPSTRFSTARWGSIPWQRLRASTRSSRATGPWCWAGPSTQAAA